MLKIEKNSAIINVSKSTPNYTITSYLKSTFLEFLFFSIFLFKNMSIQCYGLPKYTALPILKISRLLCSVFLAEVDKRGPPGKRSVTSCDPSYISVGVG